MKKKTAADSISLVEYARLTRRGYFLTREALLKGEVSSWQDAKGRWRVDRADAERVARERARRQADPRGGILKGGGSIAAAAV